MSTQSSNSSNRDGDLPCTNKFCTCVELPPTFANCDGTATFRFDSSIVCGNLLSLEMAQNKSSGSGNTFFQRIFFGGGGNGDDNLQTIFANVELPNGKSDVFEFQVSKAMNVHCLMNWFRAHRLSVLDCNVNDNDTSYSDEESESESSNVNDDILNEVEN